MPAHLVVYVACSLDGFVASLDGSLHWVNGVSAEDCRYGKFFDSVTALVMGRNTYEEILTFGVWPYSFKKTFVFSSSTDIRIINGNIEIVKVENKQDAPRFIQQLKHKIEGILWLVGGGQLSASLEQCDLVDEWVLSFIPILLGKGIPLFPRNKPLKRRFVRLHNYRILKNAVAQLHYIQKSSPRPSILPFAPIDAIGSTKSDGSKSTNRVIFDTQSSIFTYSLIVNRKRDNVFRFVSTFANLWLWTKCCLKFYNVMNIVQSALSTSFIQSNVDSLQCQILPNNNVVTVVLGKENEVSFHRFSIILYDLSHLTASSMQSTSQHTKATLREIPDNSENRDGEEKEDLQKTEAKNNGDITMMNTEKEELQKTGGNNGGNMNTNPLHSMLEGSTLISLVLSRMEFISNEDWSELCYLHSLDLKKLKEQLNS